MKQLLCFSLLFENWNIDFKIKNFLLLKVFCKRIHLLQFLSFFFIIKIPDRSAPILIDHDSSWSIMTHPDRSWPILIDHRPNWSIKKPIYFYIDPHIDTLFYTDNLTFIWSLDRYLQFVKLIQRTQKPWKIQSFESGASFIDKQNLLFIFYLYTVSFLKFKDNNKRFAISDTQNKFFIIF